MLVPVFTKRFKKDLKRVLMQHKKEAKLIKVVEKLVNKEILEPQYKNHDLKGKYLGYRECHIEPDWLLIYKIDEPYIIFERTGSHSKLGLGLF